jgi:Predicted permease
MGENETPHKKFNQKLLYYAIFAFVISFVIFIAYFTVSNLDTGLLFIVGIIKKFLHALTPLIIGVVLAYLFNKPVMSLEKIFGRIKWKRTISIIILYVLIAGAISAVINFIVPRVQTSLVQLVNSDLPKYSEVINENIQQSMEWLKSKNIGVENSSIEAYVSRLSSISTFILNWLMEAAKTLTQGVVNFVLAMVLAFYLLENKEKILSSFKELIYLYGGEKAGSSIVREVRGIDSILSGYISGVLADTVIVCILITIGLKMIGHKYFLLMGVASGILNLIPYFGSLIGGAVACLLALLQGVPEAIYTLITLIVIQQIDGNIIQPKIIGEKVGLGPLWVISAVLVFGSFWGVFGMIIAVPFTAFIKAVVKRIIDNKRAVVLNRSAVVQTQADNNKK